MSAPVGDNNCVGEYPCSSSSHLNQSYTLSHANANHRPPLGPLICRIDSNEFSSSNGSSGHTNFQTNVDPNIPATTSVVTTCNTTTVASSLSSSHDLRTTSNVTHLFYSSTSSRTSYSNPLDSNFGQDMGLGRSGDGQINMGSKANTGQTLSVLPPAFQIKQESGVSPPTRSMSVHSLPSSLISPFHLTSASGPTHSGMDPFALDKRELGGDTEVVPEELDLTRLSYGLSSNVSLAPNPHTMGYVTCASFDTHRSTVLSQSHLIGTCLLPDISSQTSLFPGHGGTLSPLPLTIATSSNPISTTQVPSSAATHRTSMGGAHLDLNSGSLMHIDSPGSVHHLTLFDSSADNSFPCILPPQPSTSSSNTSDLVNKRALSHGNGVCLNPGPCDLSISNLPLGLSPRSKARRYSYPYEPMGLSKPFAKEFQLPCNDRSNHNCTSPGLFRLMDTNNGNTSGAVNNYHLAGLGPASVTSEGGLTAMGMNGGGGRALSTPMSSCGGEDVNQSNTLGGEHALEQKPYIPLDGDVTLPGFSSPESAFYQYQHRMEGQRCQVCGELAAGFHHGAYVCEACKKFFMRHSLTDTKPTNVCPTGGNCVVAKGSRGKCQICRYRKCLYVGMKMKDPESQPELDISNIPCRVCGGRSSGFHFGALTCEGCKGFFRRTEGSAGSLVCVGGQNACTITPRSRNACKSCRFRRCIAAGMSKKGSRIGRQPNAVKFHCAIEIRQLRSIRGTYPGPMDSVGGSGSGHPGTPGPTGSMGQSAYTPFGVDVGQTIDISTNPGSSHNRSDVESPKYSPETLTPNYSNKRDSNVWMNDQKPPLSLLLFLPRASDPIDVTASCANLGGNGAMISSGVASSGFTGQESTKASQFSPSGGYHLMQPNSVCDRLNQDAACLRLSSIGIDMEPSQVSVAHSNRGNTLFKNNEESNSANPNSCLRSSVDDPLVSPGDDLHPTTLYHQHDPAKSLETYPNPVSIALHSLLAPFGYLGRVNHASTSASDLVLGGGQTVHGDSAHGLNNDNGTVNDRMDAPDEGLGTSSEHSPIASTAALITDLAQRLAEQELAGSADASEPEDVNTVCSPSHEAIVQFTESMRTATEFLRLPNTYFKTRFRMSSIPLDQHEKDYQVWNHMMNHFHMHAQQIVQFAKLVPGFNHLGITARSNLVRGAMYPVVLLLLSRDYQPETDEYNYFDFTPEERNTIMRHFPTFTRFTEHLRMAGRLMHHLGLSLPELSLLCAVEIVRNYQVLDEPTRSSTKELYILAYHSLRTCMTNNMDIAFESDDHHRWAQLVAMSKMIQAMSREHHVILTNLKDVRPDLHFPELYVEMFRLADGASALVSASAKAVTLACSSAFQTSAPLKLPLCQTAMETSPIVSQASHQDSSLDSTTATTGTTTTAAVVPSLADAGELCSGHGFFSTNDRWDAGRLALAVPAAMAAVAAVAAEASSLSQTAQQQQHQQQQHPQEQFSAVASAVYHQQSSTSLDSPGSTSTLLPRSDILTGVAYPSQRHITPGSYFTGPASSFFLSTQTQPPQS